MQPCPSQLPTLPSDLQRVWDEDPSTAVRVILDNEALQGEQYRACVARHRALIDWVVPPN